MVGVCRCGTERLVQGEGDERAFISFGVFLASACLLLCMIDVSIEFDKFVSSDEVI